MVKAALFVIAFITGFILLVKTIKARSIFWLYYGLLFLVFFGLGGLGLYLGKNILMYVALGILWVWILVISESIYEALSIFSLGLYLSLLLWGSPSAVMAAYLLCYCVGLTILCLALWDTANNRTRIRRDIFRFKRIIENPRLSRRKKIVRINGRIALEGLVLVVLSLLGMLFPDSFVGFLWRLQ